MGEGKIYFINRDGTYVRNYDDSDESWDELVEVYEDGVSYLKSDDGQILYVISRVDGPAISSPNEERWIYNGLLHNVSGPAVSYLSAKQSYYYVFGLDLSKEEFEQHQKFIKRAHSYVVRKKLSLTDGDSLPTTEGLLLSFATMEDFLEAAATDTLKIGVGPRDARKIKTVKLGSQYELGVGTGLAALGLVGGFGLLVGGMKAKAEREKTSAVKIEEPVASTHNK